MQFDKIFREFNFAQGVLALRKISWPLAARSKSVDYIKLLDEDTLLNPYILIGVVKYEKLVWLTLGILAENM